MWFNEYKLQLEGERSDRGGGGVVHCVPVPLVLHDEQLVRDGRLLEIGTEQVRLDEKHVAQPSRPYAHDDEEMRALLVSRMDRDHVTLFVVLEGLLEEFGGNVAFEGDACRWHARLQFEVVEEQALIGCHQNESVVLRRARPVKVAVGANADEDDLHRTEILGEKAQTIPVDHVEMERVHVQSQHVVPENER